MCIALASACKEDEKGKKYPVAQQRPELWRSSRSETSAGTGLAMAMEAAKAKKVVMYENCIVVK